jgi:mono/diheme cytochrome c family protein
VSRVRRFTPPLRFGEGVGASTEAGGLRRSGCAAAPDFTPPAPLSEAERGEKDRRARIVRISALVAVLVSFTACQQRMAHPPLHRPLTESDFYSDKRSARPLEEGVVHRGQILDDDPLVSGLSDDGKKEQTVHIQTDDGKKETKTGPGIPNRTKNFVEKFPFQLTEADLKRGQERYQIYCVPCHGPAGNGRGKIVERGFLEPTSFHTNPVDETEKAFRDRQERENPLRIPLGISRGFAFYQDEATGKDFRIPLREVPVGYIFEVITKGYGGMPEYAAQIPIPDRWRIAAYVRALQLSQNRSETEKALGGKK